MKDLSRKESARRSIFTADLENEMLSKIVFSDPEPLFGNAANNNPQEHVEFHWCGFIARKAANFTSCASCLLTLQETGDMISQSALTEIKDRGHLKYSSKSLFHLLSVQVEPNIAKQIESGTHRPGIIPALIGELGVLQGNGIGCSVEHAKVLIVKIVLYYISIRMYFHTKNHNRELLRSRVEAKKKMKQAKLSRHCNKLFIKVLNNTLHSQT